MLARRTHEAPHGSPAVGRPFFGPTRASAQCNEWIPGQFTAPHPSVTATATYKGQLIFGSYYDGGLEQWDCLTTPTPFRGVVFYGSTRALNAYKYPAPSGVDELIVGGLGLNYTSGGPVDNILRWRESPSGVPAPSWLTMGAGLDAQVNAIERFGGAIYAGGSFLHSGATAVNHIARWNEGTGLWERLGTGLNGDVDALRVYNGSLYVGGGFTTAGGVATGGLARWNGTSWSAVGGTFTGTVWTLEVFNGELFVGGSFTTDPNSPNLVHWNGSTFGPTQGTNGTVGSMVVGDAFVPGVGTVQRLYVSGSFDQMWAGGQRGLPLNHVFYYYDGWSYQVLSGVNVGGHLGFYNGELQVIGPSTAYDGAGNPISAVSWFRYSDSGAPWFAQQPLDMTVNSGGAAYFSAPAANGYGGLTQRWYHNNQALNDGPSGTGSIYSGTNTSTLNISNVSNLDVGNYYQVTSNTCGSATSNNGALSLPPATGVGPETELATRFEGIAPNPANGACDLTFSLARESRVRAEIDDVEGRRIVTFELGDLSPGRHQVAWDGRDRHGAAPRGGLYFVRLDASGRPIGTRRLIMTR